MNHSALIHAPHEVLGVEPSASTEQVRAAYLALVRQHPPDRDADRFREIHAAYEQLNDPLMQARAILSRPATRPDLQQIVADAEKQPARLSTLTLLALGNQD